MRELAIYFDMMMRNYSLILLFILDAIWWLCRWLPTDTDISLWYCCRLGRWRRAAFHHALASKAASRTRPSPPPLLLLVLPHVKIWYDSSHFRWISSFSEGSFIFARWSLLRWAYTPFHDVPHTEFTSISLSGLIIWLPLMASASIVNTALISRHTVLGHHRDEEA